MSQNVLNFHVTVEISVEGQKGFAHAGIGTAEFLFDNLFDHLDSVLNQLRLLCSVVLQLFPQRYGLSVSLALCFIWD